MIDINTKVIVRNNEDETYKIGILKRYDLFGGGNFKKTKLPIVDIDGVEYTCMGIVIVYDKIVTDILDKLTPKEQWNILSANYKRQ